MNQVFNSVIFVQPRLDAKQNYVEASGREQIWTPLFALALAPAAHEFDVKPELLDLRVTSVDQYELLVDKFSERSIVAISVMTGNAIHDALEITNQAKEKKSCVIWGGPHPTIFPEETLAQSGADFVISGFGYVPFYCLVRYLQTGAAVPEVVSKQIHGHVSVPVSATLEQPHIPQPDLSLVDRWDYYVNADISIGSRVISFVTSEGCTQHCTFCSEPRTSNFSWFTKPLRELIPILKRNVELSRADAVKLFDPNFFPDKERVSEFASMMREEVGVGWAATLHPKDLDAYDVSFFKQSRSSGLRRVLVGLESPVLEAVKLSGKLYDPTRIYEMVKKLADSDISGMFTFIVGWPGLDSAHYYKTIECALSIREIDARHQCKIHFLEPWPGTALGNLYTRLGFSFPDTLQKWADVNYYDAQLNLHVKSLEDLVHEANVQLSPYVSA